MGRNAAWWVLLAACAGCGGGSGAPGAGKDAGPDGSTGPGGAGGDSGAGGHGGVTADAGTGGVGGGAPDASLPDPDAPRPSAGCGQVGMGGFFQRQTATPVAGKARAYWVAAPDAPAASAPQKLVFVWHGCGGSVANIRQWLNVEDAARQAGDQALFVYAQIETAGDPSAGEGCFDSNDDQAYFQQVLGEVEAAYCVDQKKVFSTGYSSGGIMSDLLGCFHADVVRAVIPVEGGMPSAQAACPGKVDALVIHSPLDEQIGWDQPATQTSHSWTDGRGAVALGFFLQNDGCTAPPFDPGDTSLGRTDFTCAASADGVHPYRVSRWLHDYQVSWATDTPHHWFPPEAPGEVWKFIAATP